MSHVPLFPRIVSHALCVVLQGCEWLTEGTGAIELPAFPSVGDIRFEFGIPAIPRLLPDWGQLQTLGGAQAADHLSASAPGGAEGAPLSAEKTPPMVTRAECARARR